MAFEFNLSLILLSNNMNLLNAIYSKNIWRFFICCFLLLPMHYIPLFAQHNNKIRTIVIDAGHGGKDKGASGLLYHEKNITLKIALLLGDYIQKNMPHIKVIYTRRTDTFLELHERAEIANKNKADLFISIHCNSLVKRRQEISGSETFVMGLHTADENLAVAKRENAVILLEDNYQQNYDGFDPNSPEAHIMLSMYQNAYLLQSTSLANKIEYHLNQESARPTRGVKQAGFMVLRATSMPSVLLEVGFLSNDEEEKYLGSHKGQVNIATSIYRAVKEYITEVESNTTPSTKPLPVVTTIATTSIATTTKNNTINTPQNSPSTNTITNTDKSVIPQYNKNEVIFKVQLASASKMINTNIEPWSKVKYLEREHLQGTYKYMVGKFKTRAQGTTEMQYWRKNGFPDAFLVAYHGNERISLAKADELLK